MADEGRRMSLVSALRGLVDKHVKQRPRDTIVRNAIEDPAKPLARRVTEEDACEFCVGEADGKPVSPAKASRHFHRFCKCHYLLFFQETRYQDRIVDDSALRSVGIDMEEGADPDWYERRDALVLAALGRKVKFLKRHPHGPRRADTLIDGELVEFKNPTGNGIMTVQYQIQSNLHGRNKKVFKPQSDVLLISNARNSMTMAEMEESLAAAFDEESILTVEERAYMRRIILLDERTGRVRTYDMEMPALHGTTGHGHRQAKATIAGRTLQEDGKATEASLNHGRWKSSSRRQKEKDINTAIRSVKPVFITPRGNENLIANIKRISPEEGYYDIHAHGGQYSITCFNSSIEAEELVYILSRRDDYHGENIRLFCCHAGEADGNGDCFAKWLADIMGVKVKAAPDATNIGIDGSFFFGDDPDWIKFEEFFGE